MADLDFPYRFDDRGRTAEIPAPGGAAAGGRPASGEAPLAATEVDAHVRDLIEQVLFTAPGERVNRPEFGCGLGQLVFAPNGAEVAVATQFLVHGALQQALADVIQVSAVEVTADEATLRVLVSYVVRRTQEPGVARFTRGGLVP
jgi:Bacteriophage baseplate protein W